MSLSLPAQRKALLLGILLGAVVVAAVQLCYAAYRYAFHFHPARPEVARGRAVEGAADPINSSWVLEGQPRFHTTPFYRSGDGRISAGLWEAWGPGKFEWHYGTDETVLVLEGGAMLTYRGERRSVGPGQAIYFAAGEQVIWEVPERIRKTWILHEPGPVARRLRPLLGSPS